MNVWTVNIWSVVRQCSEQPNTREAYESNEGDPELTDLLNDALCCVIRAHRGGPVMSPSNIEDTAHGL
jgi:hypothetical protein